MDLKSKLLWLITPIFMLAVFDELLYTEAFMKNVRIDEIPFALTSKLQNKSRESSLRHPQEESRGIYGLKRLDQHKSFLKIFNIPCKFPYNCLLFCIFSSCFIIFFLPYFLYIVFALCFVFQSFIYLHRHNLLLCR